jgi:hypothetical protein
MGIALAMVLMAPGCSNPTNGSESPGGNLGTENLTLKGTIYERIPDYSNLSNIGYIYQIVNESGTLTAGTVGTAGSIGTAAITNGSFEIELSAPTPATALTVAGFRHWDNVQFSNESAKYAQVSFSTSGGDIGSHTIGRSKIQTVTNDTSLTTTGTREVADYYYFDADVTITGAAKTAQSSGVPVTSKALKLSFKEGWNVLCLKTVMVSGLGGAEVTVTATVSNPDLYWVLN